METGRTSDGPEPGTPDGLSESDKGEEPRVNFSVSVSLLDSVSGPQMPPWAASGDANLS
jgi:hypothetical protein